MYNNIITIKDKYPNFPRLEAKGNISLLDNVLTKKIGVVGAKNATSHARFTATNMAAVLANYHVSDNPPPDFVIVTRLTTGVDIAAHAAALYNPSTPTMKHRTIAVVNNLNDHKQTKIETEIIKSDGLIISAPLGTEEKERLKDQPKLLYHFTKNARDILLTTICDAIVICDIDFFANNEGAPYDSTKLKDPYPIYVSATNFGKKIYFCSSVEQRAQRILNKQGQSVIEIHNELVSALYSPPPSTTPNIMKGV